MVLLFLVFTVWVKHISIKSPLLTIEDNFDFDIIETQTLKNICWSSGHFLNSDVLSIKLSNIYEIKKKYY
jgi:hypothetical protein